MGHWNDGLCCGGAQNIKLLVASLQKIVTDAPGDFVVAQPCTWWQKVMKTRMEFNFNTFDFNYYKFDFNYYKFDFNYYKFDFNYYKFDFNYYKFDFNYYKFDFNYYKFDFNYYKFDFNYILIILFFKFNL